MRYRFLLLLMMVFFTLVGQTSQAQSMAPGSPLSIGVNGLFLGRVGSAGHEVEAEAPNGFSIQEVESRITSNIDPYWYGEVTLALHPSHAHHDEDGDEEAHPGEFALDLEEAFVESLRIPHIQLRLGKFYSQISRHNVLHAHAFPFIDAPLPHQSILGEEGLTEVGLSLSYLVPVSFYLELIAQGFSVRNNERFTTSTQDDVLGVYVAKSLWDLSSQTTFEVNLGYGNGSSPLGGRSEIYSAAAVLKWQPAVRSQSRRLSWTTEYLSTRESGYPESIRIGGLSSWIQYQFAPRWWFQGRAESVEFERPEDEVQRKYSGLIAFMLTEFSALRFQYDSIDGSSPQSLGGAHASHGTEQRAAIQLTMTMGAHPAHVH